MQEITIENKSGKPIRIVVGEDCVTIRSEEAGEGACDRCFVPGVSTLLHYGRPAEAVPCDEDAIRAWCINPGSEPGEIKSACIGRDEAKFGLSQCGTIRINPCNIKIEC